MPSTNVIILHRYSQQAMGYSANQTLHCGQRSTPDGTTAAHSEQEQTVYSAGKKRIQIGRRIIRYRPRITMHSIALASKPNGETVTMTITRVKRTDQSSQMSRSVVVHFLKGMAGEVFFTGGSSAFIPEEGDMRSDYFALPVHEGIFIAVPEYGDAVPVQDTGISGRVSCCRRYRP
jgi:hypothetical protein